MVTIRTMTLIDAPVELCYKLSVSIDLHLDAGADTGEEAIDGVTSGLIGAGERVTWRGRHFGLKFKHESLIAMWRPYSHFRDVMIAGRFKSFEHDHYFAPMNDGTRLRDELRFTVSGPLTGLKESLLRKHMTRFLQKRNAHIKRVAESEEWHRYLDGQPELDMRVFQAGIVTTTDGRVYAGR